MRTTAAALIVVLLVSPASSAPRLKELPKERSPLVGTWAFTSYKSDGTDPALRPRGHTYSPDGKWTVKGDENRYVLNPDGVGTIDLYADDGMRRGRYRIDGDTLFLVVGRIGRERPTDEPGQSGVTYFEMKRKPHE
jgi:hypothetical protein